MTVAAARVDWIDHQRQQQAQIAHAVARQVVLLAVEALAHGQGLAEQRLRVGEALLLLIHRRQFVDGRQRFRMRIAKHDPAPCKHVDEYRDGLVEAAKMPQHDAAIVAQAQSARMVVAEFTAQRRQRAVEQTQ